VHKLLERPHNSWCCDIKMMSSKWIEIEACCTVERDAESTYFGHKEAFLKNDIDEGYMLKSFEEG